MPCEASVAVVSVRTGVPALSAIVTSISSTLRWSIAMPATVPTGTPRRRTAEPSDSPATEPRK